MVPSPTIQTSSSVSPTPTSPTVTGHLIVALCPATNAIGKDGQLPWPRLSNDLRHFRTLTTNNAVLMGPATYNSLPPTLRPLPNRLNIVLSSRSRGELDLPPTVLLANSLPAVETLALAHGHTNVFVIGGAEVFRSALRVPSWSQRLHITLVDGDFHGDVHFPCDIATLRQDFDLITISSNHTDNGISYTFQEYARRQKSQQLQPPPLSPQVGHADTDETPYLNLLKDILHHGARRTDRTNTGTLSLFGTRLRFSLRDGKFPLLTTKRVFFRGVAEELFWFLRGCTDANALSERGVRIWDANGSRDFLDGRGLTHRRVGDLGPVYGFQWRHFGAEYTTADADYRGKGFDQIATIIDTLRNNPTDRRMLFSAWNPNALHEMALPPCHLLAQFYVDNDGALSCQMYQRSADMGLGVPFNIASYALLTRLLAQVVGLQAGELVHVMGDTHIYLNHEGAIREQLKREPKEFPTLRVKHRDNIEQFCFEDLTLEGYNPYGPISMKMAV